MQRRKRSLLTGGCACRPPGWPGPRRISLGTTVPSALTVSSILRDWSVTTAESGTSTTSCSGGVMPATVGNDKLGKTHFFPRLGRMRSNVQNDSGFFGATKQILMAAPSSVA